MPKYERDDTIGRYEVVDVLGEGAMARVYRAHDPEIGRTVAIKVLRDDLLSDTDYVARFLREARSAGAMVHPHIVTVFDVGDADGAPYIAMECVEGRPLSDRLRAGERFGPRRAIEIARQIAEALQFAHSRGVVHRDVKPSNVLFTGDTDQVKLADFGIARVDAADDADHTRSGAVMGTPRYMAPEQAAGEPAEARSDLFSLGVILYEMVGGRCPFNARTMTALLMQISTRDPHPIRKLAPETPVGTARIIGRLLSKKPEKRFQSGGQLASALAKEHDALVEHETERRRNRHVPLKIRWTAAMGLIVTLVMLATAGTVYHQQQQAITHMALDSGSSLTRYVAFDVATPLLSRDWPTLKAMVAEATRRESFKYLIVSDHEGTVRAATNTALVGEPRALPGEARPMRDESGMTVSRVDLAAGGSALNFSAPAHFQDKRVGQVDLGLSRAGLDSVMSQTGWLLTFLALTTLACVLGALYAFGALVARPVYRLRRAMEDLAAGDDSTRISVHRNDEFGILYDAFNDMAERLGRTPDSTLMEFEVDAAVERERTAQRRDENAGDEAPTVEVEPRSGGESNRRS